MTKELKFGQTPFDLMNQDELLIHAKRMYSALIEAHQALRLLEQNNDRFWSEAGLAGMALEKCRQAVDPIKAGFDSSDIFRSFYRYGDDLLFQQKGYSMLTRGWMVCQKCGAMIGRAIGTAETATACWKPGCDGEVRPLEWGDLKCQD